jgi:hypothetical protein
MSVRSPSSVRLLVEASLFVLLVSLPGRGNSSRTAETPVCRWAVTPVQIDGQVNDWPPGGLMNDRKSGADFAFMNDGRNLYGLLLLNSAETRASLEATGLTVLFRPEGSRKPERGVLFLSREVRADTYIAWQESRGAVLTTREKDELRKTARHTLVLAFAIDAKGRTYGPLQPRAGIDSPVFCTSWQGQETFCEFRVPLDSSGLVPGEIDARPGEALRISLEWGGSSQKGPTAKAGNQSQSSSSGYVSGTGRTWAQEFQDMFDPMSHESRGTKSFSFAADVRLAAKPRGL